MSSEILDLQWQKFASQTFSAASNEEIVRARVAFYSGATAVLQTLVECAQSPGAAENLPNIIDNLCKTVRKQ